jgi:serine/threonine protein kinase
MIKKWQHKKHTATHSLKERGVGRAREMGQLSSNPFDGFKFDVFQLAMTIFYLKSSKLYEKFRKDFDEYKVFLSRLKAFGSVHFVALFGFNDPVLKALLIKMLDFDPSTRISMQGVKEALEN